MNHTAEDSLPNELSKVDDAQQHKSGKPNFDAKLRRRAASAAIERLPFHCRESLCFVSF